MILVVNRRAALTKSVRGLVLAHTAVSVAVEVKIVDSVTVGGVGEEVLSCVVGILCACVERDLKELMLVALCANVALRAEKTIINQLRWKRREQRIKQAPRSIRTKRQSLNRHILGACGDVAVDVEDDSLLSIRGKHERSSEYENHRCSEHGFDLQRVISEWHRGNIIASMQHTQCSISTSWATRTCQHVELGHNRLRP